MRDENDVTDREARLQYLCEQISLVEKGTPETESKLRAISEEFVGLLTIDEASELGDRVIEVLCNVPKGVTYDK